MKQYAGFYSTDIAFTLAEHFAKGVAVTVLDDDGVTTSDLYADHLRTGGPQANPITTNATTGEFSFYAEPGVHVLLGANGLQVNVYVPNWIDEPPNAGQVTEAMLAFGVATQAELDAAVAAAVANLIAGAPGALDTLNELAAALGDDANFATTITNLIAAHTADALDAHDASAVSLAAVAGLAPATPDVQAGFAALPGTFALKAELDIRDYGGVAGVADNTAAFLALAAAAAGGSRKRIIVPSGLWITSVTFELLNMLGFVLTIDGTIKLKSGTLGASSTIPLVALNGCTDGETHGGDFDGNRDGQAGWSEQNPGLRVYGCTDIEVNGPVIDNTAGDCIYVSTSTGVWIEKPVLSDPNTGGAGNARQGIAIVGGCSDIHIEAPRFGGSGGLITGRMAIDIEPDTATLVEKVYINDMTAPGDNWNRAVSVVPNTGSTVSKVQVKGGNVKRGLLFNGSGGTLTDVAVHGIDTEASLYFASVGGTVKAIGTTTRNRDADLTKSALIYLNACSFAIITDNILQAENTSGALNGIWNEGASAYLKIHDNLIIGQGGVQMTGINLDGAVSRCSIDGNMGVGDGGTPMVVGIDLAGLSGQSTVRVGAHNHFFTSVTTPIVGQSKALGAAMLNGRSVRETGADASMGVAVLVAGAVVVATTKVTANSRIMLTTQALGTVAVPKEVAVTARTAGTSFTITSADGTDTSSVAWEIVEPC